MKRAKEPGWNNQDKLIIKDLIIEGGVFQPGKDGKADPNGIGQANCVMEFKRRGTGLTDAELIVFCRSYMKLKCDKVLM